MDDLSPSEFVKKIRELGEKRDAEDAARFASLERDILLGRQERMARRAERARSLSPEKSGHVETSGDVGREEGREEGREPTRYSEPSTASTLASTLPPTTSTLTQTTTPTLAHTTTPTLVQSATLTLAQSTTPTLTSTLSPATTPTLAPSATPTSMDRPHSAAFRRARDEDDKNLHRRSTPDYTPNRSPPDTRSTSPSRTWSTRFSSTTAASDLASLASPPLRTPKLDPPLAARPPSPTKGMGGFVESAMLKRADSVSKRWSQQPSRTNSVASRHESDRESHASVVTVRPDFGRLHSRSKSVASFVDEPQSPASPSKRWSPTKSSWLESALSKTERPPPPTWGARTVKAETDTNGDKAGDKTNLNAETSRKTRAGVDKMDAVNKTDAIDETADSLKTDSTTMSTKPQPGPKPLEKPLDKPAAKFEKTPLKPTRPTLTSNASPTTATNPLRRLHTQSESNITKGSAEPEFKNALTKLKRTHTEKYVAPDPLKDNILQGKAGLKLTGGPAPRARVDPLKESILRQKEEMKTRAAPKPNDKPVPSTPEALTKRRAMQPPEQIDPAPPRVQATPEALTRQKTLRETKETFGGVLDKPKPFEIPDPKPKPSKPFEKPELKPLQKPESKLFEKPELKPVEKPKLIAVAFEKPTEKESVAKSFGQEKPKPMVKASEPEKLAYAPADKPKPTVPQKPLSPPAKPRFDAVKPFTTEPPAPQPTPEPKPTVALKPGVSGKLADRFTPSLGALAGVLARGPPGARPEGKSGPSAPSASTVPESKPAELTHMTKGRAKGPKRRAPKTKEPTTQTQPLDAATKPSEPTPDASDSASEIPAKSPPKPALKFGSPSKASFGPPKASPFGRKLPELPKPAEPTPVELSKPELPKPASPSLGRKLPELPKPTDAKPQPPPPLDRKLPEPPKPESSKPSLPFARKLPEILRPESKPAEAADPAESLPKPTSPPVRAKSPLVLAKVASPGRVDSAQTDSIKTDDKAESVKRDSVKAAAALWGRSPSPPARTKSPVKLPTREDERRAAVEAGLVTDSETPTKSPPLPPKPIGLGLGRSADPPPSIAGLPRPDSDLLPTTPTTPTPNPLQSFDFGLETPPTPRPPESPIPHTSEAAHLFGGFFGARPALAPADAVDTLSIIQADPLGLAQPKSPTVRASVYEVGLGGEVVPVPQGRQHVLFDAGLYVIVHTTAADTEVFLWAGAAVPGGALMNAQVAGRRVARDNGCGLTTVHAGKEHPRLLQALGGILITFRGARPAWASGLPERFILCARRHLGHVVFDEVSFTADSFCAGFAYLVRTPDAIWLWKGIGCSADELGCARLMAVDLGPVDAVEITDGAEPAEFLALFGGQGIPRSAAHWRRKGACDRYRTRLFRVAVEALEPVETETPLASPRRLQVSSLFGGLVRRPSWGSLRAQSPAPSDGARTPRTPLSPVTTGDKETDAGKVVVSEVAPFVRSDLDEAGVCVLDAWFEVYVIIGTEAQTQRRAFAAALLFAQDYGILAAGVEDRPFVPVSTVVVQGAPRDMRACFRCWDEEAGLKRGKSLRCVGLDAALAAAR
ncbi:hypothetical protein EJ06DRAFT_551667 [Trichodelitschia bisporula]|uniref:DUF4045 domain-containing protein n=1 Tax=Trichodelitschia bisporula TaxID=703511 RepID=A0A6G1HJN6_9PEZI|nr:hypothetical protein EJ06DRAFT_551667 [Trichodelitschia bisporula]